MVYQADVLSQGLGPHRLGSSLSGAGDFLGGYSPSGRPRRVSISSRTPLMATTHCSTNLGAQAGNGVSGGSLRKYPINSSASRKRSSTSLMSSLNALTLFSSANLTLPFCSAPRHVARYTIHGLCRDLGPPPW